MAQDERCLLKTFANEPDAQVTSSLLSAHGIESFIQADNVAGLHPELSLSSGVKLFVPRASFEMASALVKGTQEPFAHVQSNDVVQGSTQPKSSRQMKTCLLPLIVGLLIGISVGFIGFKRYYTEVDFVDVNSDGVRDRGYYYVSGFLEKISVDTNLDGKFDSFTEYINQEQGEMSMDTNYDGSIDTWAMLKYEMTSEMKTDLDANSVPDIFYYYDDDYFLSKTEIRPNNSTVVERMEIYNRDFTWSEFVDLDKDGTFDIRDDYDCFNNKIKTETLN